MHSAEAEEQAWRRHYEAFTRLYRGRDDVIAERQSGEYVPVPGAGLSFERFVEHVRMERTYAVYNRDDSGCVSFGLFDVDVLPRDQGWEKILPALETKKRETRLIMQALEGMGLERRHLLIEFPTVGFHLLLFFDRPVAGAAVKRVMRFVLAQCGLDEVPFYPKKVEEPGWGDRVQLPLRINLNTGRRSNFVRDLDSFDPEHYGEEPDFAVLDGIDLVDSQWVDEVMRRYRLE